MIKSYFSAINFTFRLLSFEKSLSLIKLLDFGRVDIALIPDESCTHLNTFEELERPQENGRKLMEKLNSKGLVQTDTFLFTGEPQKTALNHPDIAVREFNADIFRRAVDYTNACGCNHITMLPGIEFNDGYSVSLKRASEELEWRVDYAEQRGITLSVEAHVGSIVDMPEKATELLDKTAGLTLTLDYSHFIKNGAKQDDIDPLISRASHMHFRNAKKGVSQTIFDESEIDYLRIIRLLKQSGYKGALTIEFCSSPWDDQNRVDTIGETIVLRDYLINNWGTA